MNEWRTLLDVRDNVKPRPHQQQCRSSTVECYKSNDSFDKVECWFDTVFVFSNNVAVSANSVERNFVLSTKSKQIEQYCQNGRRFLTNFKKMMNIANWRRGLAIAERPARCSVWLSVEMLYYCCANNANRSPVSAWGALFSNCRVFAPLPA